MPQTRHCDQHARAHLFCSHFVKNNSMSCFSTQRDSNKLCLLGVNPFETMLWSNEVQTSEVWVKIQSVLDENDQAQKVSGRVLHHGEMVPLFIPKKKFVL